MPDSSAFDRLCRPTRPILDDCGLASIAVRTNFRKVIPHNWEHCFAACVAGVLHQFAGSFGFGMVGSSEPYKRLVFPWGSTPATDYLLSGDAMEIVHEGAGYSRTEKVAQLVCHQAVTDCVKVCWEGREADRNCGHCEKYVRTRLNFLAAGLPDPKCFDTPFDISMIDNITPRNSAQTTELATILKYADERGVSAEWVDRLDVLGSDLARAMEPAFVDLVFERGDAGDGLVILNRHAAGGDAGGRLSHAREES